MMNNNEITDFTCLMFSRMKGKGLHKSKIMFHIFIVLNILIVLKGLCSLIVTLLVFR